MAQEDNGTKVERAQANRTACVTRKIRTEFGSHYLHADIIGDRIVGISVSSPQKFDSTALGALFVAINEAAAQLFAAENGGVQ